MLQGGKVKDTRFAQKSSFGLVHRRFKKKKEKRKKKKTKKEDGGSGGFSGIIAYSVEP